MESVREARGEKVDRWNVRAEEEEEKEKIGLRNRSRIICREHSGSTKAFYSRLKKRKARWNRQKGINIQVDRVAGVQD